MMARQASFDEHLERFPQKFRRSLKAKLGYKDVLEQDGRLYIPSRIWLAFLTPPDKELESLVRKTCKEVWRLKKKMLETFEHPKLFLCTRDPMDHSSDCVTLALLEILYDLNNGKILLPKKRYEEWLEVANHFGLWKLRYALEDAAFKTFDPQNFALFESVVERQRFVEAHLVRSVRAIVSDALTASGLKKFTIENRRKNIYGVYQKVQVKNKSINDIFDIHGFRILTQTSAECYKVADVLHRLWRQFPERYKDYIAKPKANRYQSIHTVLKCLEGKLVEFQVRTYDMDAIASLGPANHVEYKKREKRR